MNEGAQDLASGTLEARSRALFHESVDGVDMRIRSRLMVARHAALETAAVSKSRAWFSRIPLWTPAAGVAAAALLGVALWMGSPPGTSPGETSLEDLDMVTASDGTSGDALEMLQDDLDFYDFAGKAASSEPAA